MQREYRNLPGLRRLIEAEGSVDVLSGSKAQIKLSGEEACPDK